MAVAATRHFVGIGNRHVHYRRAGSGPALLLLHQSPQNSRMCLEMMARFSSRYTVIAPDTPGFGYSDPLPEGDLQVADFGAATLEFVNALGLGRFAVFGMHTGGLIATWLAWSQPSRIAALVVDGYAAFTPEESAMYGDAYLPPFVPAWDGSHLRWLWARVREQKYFFPWYDGRAEAAMAIAPQSSLESHEAVRDVLDVGDHYRSGYAAAFRHNDHHWLAGLKMPGWLVYRHDDPLRAHLPRLQGLPGNVRVVDEPGGIPAMHAAMDDWLQQTLAVEADAGSVFSPAVEDGGAEPAWARLITEGPGGELALWRRDGAGVLNVLLHSPGERPWTPERIGDAGAWLLPELPGHGASSETGSPLVHVAVVEALLDCLASVMPERPLVLHAHGAAAGYVPALADGLGARLQEVVLHAPWLLEADEQAWLLENLPAGTIDRAGGHLCDLWQWERERHLLWPWQPPAADARRRVDAPDPAFVHDNVVELLRLGSRLRALLAGATTPGLADRLRALQVPLRVTAGPGDDYRGRAAALLQQP